MYITGLLYKMDRKKHLIVKKYLEDHSKIRRKVYQSEKGFEVQWPKKKN